ncbi:pyridoxal phosphate-dependent transferase [Amylocarpus encephaloides]|uniref:sphinganine-1-phosphate aldolase n=1 Tax=Amylocarpus encephaloides TaxID=45428 RepID=A0A9P7YAJ0_9HELO|nr:pyridoxal phosphate-dependent transferase [Amylocarpus encephaloides]
MPGSSRMPVSLRNSFALQKGRSSSQLLSLNVDLFRNVVFFLFLLRWTRKGLLKLKGRGLFGTFADAYMSLRKSAYGLFLRAPGVRSQVQKQVSEAITKLQAKLVPSGPGIVRYLALPKEGWSEETVMKELDALATMDHTRWEDGYVSGAVYHGGDQLMKMQTEAFGKFTVANPLHPDVFPGVRKMEAEIVAMVLAMFNAPLGAAGVTTSGGTESILMACLSARQKARAERGVTEPEMILPETAHTAFRKAGEYFGIKCHLVACPAPNYQGSISAISRLINSNTILLVGSAPNFPHGIIDDISALSKLALKRRIPLHVDCCLGSFLVPFLEKAGFETELFDFRLKGVTSISCDTHKYGFAPKGNSTILYRTTSLRAYQYFISPDWSGGVYASPSIAGSRPGALIAGCWASLMQVGETGYINSCNQIVGATKKITEAIQTKPGLCSDLEVIGKPIVSVVAFTSNTLDTYDIADAMSAKGWHLNSLQNPPAIHVAVTLPIVKVWEKLVADLEAVVEGEKEKERVRIVEGKGAKGKAVGDSAALYGVAGSLPNKSVVVELASGFLDTLYKA